MSFNESGPPRSFCGYERVGGPVVSVTLLHLRSRILWACVRGYGLRRAVVYDPDFIEGIPSFTAMPGFPFVEEFDSGLVERPADVEVILNGVIQMLD